MDPNSKWFYSFLIVVALCTLIGGILSSYWSNQLAIEAVKQGLVQDQYMHWVKPAATK
jgi:CHASE3 domain sensor protein